VKDRSAEDVCHLRRCLLCDCAPVCERCLFFVCVAMKGSAGVYKGHAHVCLALQLCTTQANNQDVYSLQLCTTQANRMRCFHCSYARHRPIRCVFTAAMHDTGQQDEVFSLQLCTTQANRMRCFHCSYARHRPTRCVFTAAMHDTGQQDEVFSLQLCTTQANRMRCFRCRYARHRPTG